jgi:nitrogen regulatory protein P-II 1
MKKIEAIIKPHALGAVTKALGVAGVGDVTVSEAQGRGRHRGGTEIYRGAVYAIETFAKVRIEVVVPDERVDEIVSLLCRTASTRGLGNGKVLVAAVTDTAAGPA